MKLLLKIILGLFLLTFAINLAELPFKIFNQGIAYQSCALLRDDFPAGVSRDWLDLSNASVQAVERAKVAAVTCARVGEHISPEPN